LIDLSFSSKSTTILFFVAELIEGDLMRDLMQFNSFRQQASMLNSVMQPAQSRMQQAFMGGQPQSMMMNPFAMQAAQ
jgi:hypothetical protein